MRIFLILLTSVAVMALSPSAALSKKKKRRVVYSAEFVIPFTCGSNPADVTSAVPGDYAVGIDLLGASADATVAAKVHFTYPPGGQMPAFTSDTIMLTIGAGSALQMSCDDLTGSGFVFATPPPATTYVQGLLVLTTRSPVQVFVTRSAAGAAGGMALATDQVVPGQVAAMPAPEGAQTTVCHAPPGNPANAHTITIGASALPAHLGHGDVQGACPAP